MTPLLDARSVAIEGRLKATDLRVSEPSLVALIGPNGGGKTSLLRAFAGVGDTVGRITVDGEQLTASPPARRARLVSLLPATREMVWPIAARDVIALGVAAPADGRVDQLLDWFELRPLADRPLNRLSTGERSRVLFARALAASPRLLLLDEPLANLDPYWVLRTLELVREEIETNRCAAILSLHDLSQLDHFDRLLLLSEGRIIADGEPSAVAHSADLANAFGVVRDGYGWRIRRAAGRQSSP